MLRCRTASATEPWMMSARKRWPWVAIAMRSHASRSAAAAISADGSPEASTQSASNPSAVRSAQTRSM
jgi:hypothetical protein